MHYRVVDLFAGSGAFTFGVLQAGIEGPVLLLDADADCLETCSTNLPLAQTLHTDIRDAEFNGITADIILAAPPCQGFSAIGRRSHDDPRNFLYREVVRAVREALPKFVVVENVPNFLRHVASQDLVAHLEALGYKVQSGVLNAVDFGAAQIRKRAVIVASREKSPPWPKATHGPRCRPHRTVADALAMLPRDPTGENWHRKHRFSDTYVERFRSIPAGGSRLDLPSDLTLECWRTAKGHTDVMGRLLWTRPSTTLRTEFFRPEKGRFLHPSEDRPLTLREGARLQGFPDSYRFPDSQTMASVARQIGNAIPPPLSRAIGLAIKPPLASKTRAAGGGADELDQLPSTPF